MKIRVLIVDDEFTLAETVAEMLAERGYDADVAINGKLGLDRLRTDGAHLVMMDVMMPIMDGPTLLREMRRDPALRDIPVVMMTAVPEALPADEPPLHQGTLVKPFSPDSLFRLVDRLANGERR
jgi:CheY-like chemotaxis protein